MSDLKEKASQGCYHCSCCSHYHGIKKGCDLPKCAFVPRKLLDDAQKEIDDLNESWQKCYTEWERKRLELKQKLQRWFEDLGRWIFSQREDWEHPKLPQNLKERFMELLKEEKEAK